MIGFFRVLSSFFIGFACVMGLAVGHTGPAFADQPVLLTITSADQGVDTHYTREDLETFEWHSLTTHTSFAKGEQTFEGPLLRDVLVAEGITGGTLHARAVDGYSTEIAVHLATEYDVVLALRHNDQDLTVRTKGPLRLVFPLTLQQARERHRAAEMIWQLTHLEFGERP